MLPDGQVMSMADLPERDTRRWVASRKAAVVRGVAHGLITRSEAMERYRLSEEELAKWVRLEAESGTSGLRATVRGGQRERAPQP